MGVELRRRFGFQHGTLTSFEDEDLTAGAAEPDPSEELELRWATLDEARKLIKSPELSSLLEQAHGRIVARAPRIAALTRPRKTARK